MAVVGGGDAGDRTVLMMTVLKKWTRGHRGELLK
jgi:hypothetical protein